jgi:hypothetical protein
MVDLLIVLLSKSDEAVVYLTKRRIFVTAESLGKDEKNFFEMICSHSEQEVREMSSTILVFVMTRLLHIGGEENLQAIDAVVTQLLDLMPNEAQKHHMKLNEYFCTLLDLAKAELYFL